MNKKFVLGSAMAALIIAGAPFVALAHDTQVNAGPNVGSSISSFIGSHFGVKADANVNVSDKSSDKAYSHQATSTPYKSVAAGTVTAVNGSSFTIAGLFGKSTTTVVENANTAYKAKGGATSSVAINVGSRVFVVGTTTATSTSGNTVEASLVVVLGKCFEHLRMWFGFHNK